MTTRRQILQGLPAIWLANSALAAQSPEPAETLEAMLGKLRDKIHDEMPDLSKVQITYDPANRKVPLMVLAMRV